MTPPLVHTAIAVVRLWTRVYTAGMHPTWSAARRAEIESDLWELQHDPDRVGPVSAVQLIVRLLAGATDDLFWRLERAPIVESVAARRFVSMGVAASLLVVLMTVPPRFGAGDQKVRRTRVDECASAFPRPLTTAELRVQVVSCAGVFFAERRPAPFYPSDRSRR